MNRENSDALTRLGFPDVGRNGRFVLALGIDALGSGIWLPLSLLYFLRTTGLDLVEVGLAMSVANLLVVPLVPVIGQLVDAVRGRWSLPSRPRSAVSTRFAPSRARALRLLNLPAPTRRARASHAAAQ